MANESYNYCRLCAKLKLVTALVDVENETEEIINKLSRINAVADLKSSKLPKTCCTECIVTLNTAFEFVLAVERAQNILAEVNPSIKHECPDEGETHNTLLLKAETESMIEIKLEKHDETASDDSAHDAMENDNCSLLEKAVTSSTVISKKAKTQKKKVRRKLKKYAETTSDDTDHDESGMTQAKKKVRRSPIKRTNVDTATDNEITDLKNIPTWKDYVWKCSICDTQFPTHVELKTHSMEFHKICNAQRCVDCNLRRGTLDNFILHVRRHREYFKYSCYTCFQRVETPSEAHVHKLTHLPTPNICKGCNSTFSTQQELTDHRATYFKGFRKLASKKPNSNELTCKDCNKTYRTAIALSRHLIVHTERKRDQICDSCGKSFHNKYILKAHMAVHSEDRPFPCDICKQRFKVRAHLLKHLKNHLAERQFCCDQCGKSFKCKRNLESHQIVHTDLHPHVCSYCNKGFRFKCILDRHVRQHTGVKPHSCSVCGREFTEWSNYNKHMKRRHNMNMAKRKIMSYSEDEETKKSEDAKKYAESVFTEIKRGRTKIVKPLVEIIDPQTSLQEIIDHQPLQKKVTDEQPSSSED